jgi:hypothetical protein
MQRSTVIKWRAVASHLAVSNDAIRDHCSSEMSGVTVIVEVGEVGVEASTRDPALWLAAVITVEVMIVCQKIKCVRPLDLPLTQMDKWEDTTVLVRSLNQREQNGQILCLKWVGLLELARKLFRKAGEDSLRTSPATWPKWTEVV